MENNDSKLNDSDLHFLRRAIELSQESRKDGRHPFGSLVVGKDGQILAEAFNNSMPPEGDPTQHAELQVAARSAQKVAQSDLEGATLFTSAEPCVMCTGAAYWTGIGRIVYALSEHRLLELTGANPENPTFDLPCREVVTRGQREVEIIGPVLEGEAAEAHRGFWD